MPGVVGVESDPRLFELAQQKLRGVEQVTLVHDDFLSLTSSRYDFVIGNPPYVPITGLSVEERTRYRQLYETARGRFDLYMLFFEQALRVLKPTGRLVFVTPEKFLYVQTAEPLRRRLSQINVEEIELIEESAFGELVTYPTVTTISGVSPSGQTRIKLRDGTVRSVKLAGTRSSWLPLINGNRLSAPGPTLSDGFRRISCGVATGADSVYVVANDDLPASLRSFAFPTLSGRKLAFDERITTTHSMLLPYHANGSLLSERDLGALGDYLNLPARRARLLQRTCVARKPWYAFHENPPLDDILRPKILCKDIGSRPWFVVDELGGIVPRHSVYYLVPYDPGTIHELCEYLNSSVALEWLMAHCQRAANGFIRLQSHVLKQMPMPERFASVPQLTYV